jgi:hypothetical protein
MIELAFVACLSAAPTQCEDRALQFSDLSVRSCEFGAAPYLAQWVGEHPGWQIARWSCQSAEDGVET